MTTSIDSAYHPDRSAPVYRESTTTVWPEAALKRLHEAQRNHGIWQNRLLKASIAGELTRSDYQFIFSQYYLYSKNFTRYLAALMANCDSDYHRARLAENLWEEGGMAAPQDRHAEIFRRFLTHGLGVDLESIEYLDSTRYFVHRYLDFCIRSEGAAGAAFLSLGTEGIVARIYEMIVKGLKKADIADEHLRFFYIHMECDDEHAKTLEDIMLSYSGRPDWYETCLRAMDEVLRLRARFFDSLYDQLQIRRLAQMMAKIDARESLVGEAPDMGALKSHLGAPGNVTLYENVNPRLNIDFAVERAPMTTEVLDARILRIKAAKNNELHRHPHESLFYVVSGKGSLRVNGGCTDLEPGDLAFVPRWAMHQTFNRGDEELVILAVTDFAMTRLAFVGDHLKSTRMKGTQAALPGEQVEAVEAAIHLRRGAEQARRRQP